MRTRNMVRISYPTKELIEKILDMSPQRMKEWLEKHWETIIKYNGETAELLISLIMELAEYYEHPTPDKHIRILVKLMLLYTIKSKS